MVKLVFCLRRRSDVSREDFRRYWYERHSQVVLARAATLGIRRYVQLHTLDSPVNVALRSSRHAPEPYDGVAELWWEDEQSLAAATESPEGRRAARELIEDEARFIDLSRSPVWVGHEREILAPGGEGF